MAAHETKIRVQYYETDAMGIVHHSNYIRYFETARTEMLRSHGYSYDDMEKAGVWMPVLSVTAEYKHPAVYDEVISVFCCVEKLRGASVELAYEVRGADGRLCATGRSSHGFTDSSLKPIKMKKRVPELYEFFRGMEIESSRWECEASDEKRSR